MSVTLALPAALAAALVAVAFLFLRVDRSERPLRGWLVATAAWGLAGPAALAAAGGRLPDLLEPPLSGGALPELWLADPLAGVALPLVGIALPVFLVARSRALDGPSVGAVFGLAAGTAFSAGMHLLLAARAPWHPAAAALPFVTLLHAAAGATVGAGIGLAKLAAARATRAPAAAGALAAAAALAAVLGAGALAGWRQWGEGSIAFDLALAAAAAAALAGVFAGALAFERRVLTGQLAEEVALGVLPHWVTEVVPSYRRRVRADWWERRDERREIVGLLLALAFRKRRLRSLPPDRARLYGLEVGRLRQRAKGLLALAPAPAPEAPSAPDVPSPPDAE